MDEQKAMSRREHLQIIQDLLVMALDHADGVEAHLLAAKIEDSRVCVQELLDSRSR